TRSGWGDLRTNVWRARLWTGGNDSPWRWPSSYTTTFPDARRSGRGCGSGGAHPSRREREAMARGCHGRFSYLEDAGIYAPGCRLAHSR
ncbi:unnamed protein product, partial [Ectocarpus sp. 12 AP-2014]